MNKEKKPRKKLTPGRIYAVVLAVVVLCCIMLSVLETRNGWEWDITVGNLYTLSDETVSVLEDVDTPINIYTLYSLGNYNKTILTLLEKYQFYCKNITVSNIDPMGDRLDVKELEGVGDFINEGALIVTDEKSGRSRVIDVDDLYMTYDGETYFFAENRITDAIDYVTTGSFRRILLTAGHRETSAEELDKFIKHMTMQNYIVEEYDYLHTTVVPDPATDILLSVSPKEDYAENEAQSIRDFTENGGTFILLYDYAEYDEELGSISYSETSMPNLHGLLRKFGMELGKGIVAGKDAAETGFRNTVVELRAADPSVQDAVFSECTYLKDLHSSEYERTPLLVTSEKCTLQFADGDISSEQPPYTAAMLAERGNGCAAVFATSSFISDTELSVSGNDTLIGSVLKRSSVSYPRNIVRAKRVATDELNIHSMLIKVVLTVCAAVLLPCGILAVGIVTVSRRRRASGAREAE